MNRVGCHFETLESRALPSSSYILTNEHADLQVAYTAASGWNMFVRDKDVNQDYPVAASGDPPTTVEYVHPTYGLRNRPTPSSFDFIGVGANQPYYLLPQIQNPNLLYHGFGAETMAPGTASSYDATAESHGRVNGSGAWIKLQLVSVVGPGSLSVWQNGDSGPIRFMSSYNDGIANPDADGVDYTDGISADDAVWMYLGAHVHMNFGFTAIGRYEVTLRPSALISGVLTTGPDFKFVYSVGNVGQLSFTTAAYSVNEGAGTAHITLTRTGGSDGSVEVDYATEGGSATADVDYPITTGTVLFDDQETSKSFTIPIINDSLSEPDETVGLTLSNFRPWNKPADEVPNPPLTGAISSATLTIHDNDSGVTAPPTVTGVTFGDGTSQRSQVRQIVVTFSESVTFMGSVASAFTVHRSGTGGTIGDVTLTANPATGPASSVTITFSGGLTESAGSLVDGLYDFMISAAQVSGAGGLLDGNYDAVPGGSYSITGSTVSNFYRLFGDDNGDGTVNQVDFITFRLAFLAGPNTVFDFDNDGQVSQPDYDSFRLRFLGSP